MDEKIIEYLETSGTKIPIVFLIIVIIFLITNTENVLLAKSLFWGLISKPFVFAKKKQMSTKVRGTILKSMKEQNIKDNNIIPSDLKVIWVNTESHDSFVNNNQIIVRIKHTSNPHENLITAVSEYIGQGLLYNVKRYINKDVIEASKILMTRKVVQSASRNSLTYLDEKYIFPQIEENIELKELYNELKRIDNNGMFVHIMLNEFNKAGMSIFGEIEDPQLIAESKEFMNFLYKIAIKSSNEIADLCFNREYFKVAIFLTASNKTLSDSGIQPFIQAASHQLSKGIETIYIFGLGTKRDIAKQISEELDTDCRIHNITKHPYKHINASGKRTPGVFYECEIFSSEENEYII